jgi:glycerophosphoryl diester phosphodiesterase
MKSRSDSSLINLRDYSRVNIRKPILVAHRGGVITPNSPENSLAAIRFSGDNAYDMVELDVVEAKDNKPVLFHGPKGHLGRDCGVDAYVHDLPSEELVKICYRESNQHIATLADSLELCYELSLGAMLDIKNYGHQYSEQFFAQIADLLKKNKLCNASLSFSQDPLAHKYLGDVLMLAVSEEERNRLSNSQGKPLENRWWFGLPEQATTQTVTELQKRRVLVIIAINRFRYPSHAGRVLAERDVQRLIEIGVDGLQIDSIYYQIVEDTYIGKL